jgi:hypothetical protein
MFGNSRKRCFLTVCLGTLWTKDVYKNENFKEVAIHPDPV